ncbi:MAG TPA: Ig-like domain-containing protein [Methylomirabilota bacterium]|nr:Ig-like domain-containing protein [Methylomirabilota bacterium]
MDSRPARLLAAATTFVSIVIGVVAPAMSGPTVADLANAPLHFEENRGQAAPGVRFTARGPGYTVDLGAERATLTLASRRGAEAARIDVVVVGAREGVAIEAEQPLPGRAHVYRGADASQWVSSIPLYGRVTYRGVYPGIDLIYYGAGRRLEYDFVVAPGADPGRIVLAIQGADDIALDAAGDLVLTRGERDFRMHRPVAYQETDGRRVPVEARFQLAGDRVTFVVGDYDRALPLVIDPVVTYATYIGGSIADWASAVAVDAAGNAYIAGSTGAYQQHDSFVTKLSADGRTILYQTSLLGGSNVIAGIAIDAGGNAYVAGSVVNGLLSPRPFPVTANALQPTYGGECESFSSDGDGFVAKLAADGTLAYSSFLGGKCGDAATGIALDGAGNVYVAGYTEHAASFPTAGAQFADPGRGGAWAFVAKMPPDFSTYTYSTLLGGTGSATAGFPGSSYAAAIAVDSAGAAYVTGVTDSVDFPTTEGAIQRRLAGYDDAFVAKLAPDGSRLIYSTYLGSATAYDDPFSIAVDAAGNAYVGGSTSGTGFPGAGLRIGSTSTTRLYVAKISPDGVRLLYGALIGASAATLGGALAIDAAGHAYLAGTTYAPDFPAIASPQACATSTGGSNQDAFVLKLSPDASWLHYSACVGGTGTDGANGLAVDGAGAAYVVGATNSFDFPTKNAAIPARPTGSENYNDGFAAKLAPFSAATNATPTLQAAITGPTAGTTLRDTAWVDVWVEGATGSATTFTLLVGDQTVGAQTISGIHATIPWDTRLTPDGTVTLTARVRDAAGNHGSVTRSFVVSNGARPGPAAAPALSPLTLAITTPSADGMTATTPFEINAVVQNASSAAVSFDLTIDGRLASRVLTTRCCFSYNWNPATVANGSHTLVVTARDDAGRSATATRTVNVTGSTAPPLVPSFTSPEEGATVSGTVEIRSAISGAVGTPIHATMWLEGTIVFDVSNSSSSYVHLWDTTKLRDGTYTFTLWAEDTTFRRASASRTFRVANGGGTPPPPPPPAPLTASFTSPAEGATVNGTVTVGMSESGANGTPITFTLNIDGAQVYTTSGTATTASYAWNTAGVASGSHTLALTVRDGAGRSATATRTVTVSTPAPPPPPPPGTIRVFITQPSEGATATGSVWFTIWIENAAAGTKTFTLSSGGVTGGSTTSTSNGPVSFTWDSRTVPNGTQTVTATVSDSAGNTGSATRTLNVSNSGGGTPPPAPLTAAFTSPAAGATVTGSVTVGMSESGANGTPITFTLTVDGAQVYTTSGTATTASYTWNTAGVADGTRTLGLTVSDGAGRTATATRTVTVNNAPPPPPPSPGTIRVFITQPGADGATVSGTTWFTVWIENAAAGSKTYTLSVGGTAMATTATTSNGPVTIPWNTTSTANGSRAVTVTVQDSAGATGSAVRTVNVSN